MTVASKNLGPRYLGLLHMPSPAICFAAVSAALLAPWMWFYLFNPFGFDSSLRDTWHHVAVLRELMADPFTPSNPHIPTDEGSRYYSPVNVLAALIGRLFALSPYTLFNYMGVLGLVGLVAGCWSFGRTYFVSAWAPLLLLVSLLFVWGMPTSHAGFHNYATWLSSASYPSSIALVLGLFLWSTSLGVVQRPTVLKLFGLAMLAAVILLMHQLSGAIMIVGAGGFVFFRPQASIRDKVACLGALGVGCLATLAWPYFGVVDVLASTTDDRWQSAFADRNRFSTAMHAAIIPMLGIIGFRKPSGALRFELVVPTAVFLLGYMVLQALGSPVAHRLPPAFIIFCQLGFVWMVLERWQMLRDLALLRIGAFVTVALIFYVSITASLAPRLNDLNFRANRGWTLETAQWIGRFLPDDSVTFATDGIVYPLQSTGRRVVSIPRPEPAAPSLGVRQAATDRFFDAQTSQTERHLLIERWNATHAVFHEAEVEAAAVEQLRELGTSTTFQPGLEVVTFDKVTPNARGNGQ